ncbi:MAG: hypothetical protein R3F56_09300 [Planctomycetota bacterium]
MTDAALRPKFAFAAVLLCAIQAGIAQTNPVYPGLLTMEVSDDGENWYPSVDVVEAKTWIYLQVRAANDDKATWYTLASDATIDANSGYFGHPDASEGMRLPPPRSFDSFLNPFLVPRSSNEPYDNGSYPDVELNQVIAVYFLRKALFAGTKHADNPDVFGDPLWASNGSSITQPFGVLPSYASCRWDSDMQDGWAIHRYDDASVYAYNLEGVIQRWTYFKLAYGQDPAGFFASPIWTRIETFIEQNQLMLTMQPFGVRSPTFDPNDPNVPYFGSPDIPPRLAPYPMGQAPTYTGGLPIRIRFQGSTNPQFNDRAPTFLPAGVLALPVATAHPNQVVVNHATGWVTGLQVRLLRVGTTQQYTRDTAWAGFGRWSFVMPSVPTGVTMRLIGFRYPNPSGGYYPWQTQGTANQAQWQIVP